MIRLVWYSEIMHDAEAVDALPLPEAVAILVAVTRALGFTVQISYTMRGVRGTARGHGATFDASNSDGADPANVHAAIASLADMVAAHLDSAMPENMAPDASRPPLNAN